MIRILFLLFLSFPINGYAQNLGMGVIKVDYTKLPVLKFYSDTTSSSPLKTISITRDKEGEYVFKNAATISKWFAPEQLSMEYDIFVLRVDTIINNWYHVYTDNENGTKFWLKKHSTIKYIPWRTFLLKETTAIEKAGYDLDIKTEADDKSKTIKKIEVNDCFEVLDIKGDWMKIRTNTILDCSNSKKPIKSGWIRWRIKNKLTISYGLTC
jgi:hypothetical protein